MAVQLVIDDSYKYVLQSMKLEYYCTCACMGCVFVCVLNAIVVCGCAMNATVCWCVWVYTECHDVSECHGVCVLVSA